VLITLNGLSRCLDVDSVAPKEPSVKWGNQILMENGHSWGWPLLQPFRALVNVVD